MLAISSLYRSSGLVKSSIVFRIVPDGTQHAPGLYYLRLVSGFDSHEYVFKAADWKTGDTNRVAQSNISYSTANNTITVRATGDNNVCLSLDVEKCLYKVRGEYKYLVVKGKNLSSAAGKSYLWWLNGVNKGSQIAPTKVKKADDGDVIVAWDMTRSTLDANNTGDRFSVCQGQTIFGLTSTTGTSVIKNIGFYESVEAFELLTKIVQAQLTEKSTQVYGLDGRRRQGLQRGLNIINRHKYLINK